MRELKIMHTYLRETLSTLVKELLLAILFPKKLIKDIQKEQSAQIANSSTSRQLGN